MVNHLSIIQKTQEKQKQDAGKPARPPVQTLNIENTILRKYLNNF